MNVSLTPELELMVKSKVQSGRYNSASEVVREALMLMDERDRTEAMHKQGMNHKIAVGFKSLKVGRCSDSEDFFAQLDAELEIEILSERTKNSNSMKNLYTLPNMP